MKYNYLCRVILVMHKGKYHVSCRVVPPTVKVISANGQISFGKQFAVRQVFVEKQKTGVWLISTATVISDTERWLHEA